MNKVCVRWRLVVRSTGSERRSDFDARCLHRRVTNWINKMTFRAPIMNPPTASATMFQTVFFSGSRGVGALGQSKGTSAVEGGSVTSRGTSAVGAAEWGTRAVRSPTTTLETFRGREQSTRRCGCTTPGAVVWTLGLSGSKKTHSNWTLSPPPVVPAGNFITASTAVASVAGTPAHVISTVVTCSTIVRLCSRIGSLPGAQENCTISKPESQKPPGSSLRSARQATSNEPTVNRP
mmetsp:Transcript_50690/g.133613  ORF Transcript_50690/g.133613 Transcript_50690/m.133613 type:complete len:235 (+) Transcript_50690:695-1399(+)